MTRDIDIAVLGSCPAGGDADGSDAPRRAGLRHDYRSVYDPPVISFIGTLHQRPAGQHCGDAGRDTRWTVAAGSGADAGCVSVQQEPYLRSKKDPLKKAKDLYYIFGVLESHEEELPECSRPGRPGKEVSGEMVQQAHREPDTHFTDVEDIGVRMVVTAAIRGLP